MNNDFNFEIICQKCRSTNIKFERDYDYVFDGDSDVLVNTGDVVFECLNCKNSNILYTL